MDATLHRGREFHPDVVDLRVANHSSEGRDHEHPGHRRNLGHADPTVRRWSGLQPVQLHPRAADEPHPRANRGNPVRPLHGLRGIPRVPHGRSPDAWRIHRPGDPLRRRQYRWHHHRRRTDHDRRLWCFRVLQHRDDEVHRLRHDHRPCFGRHRHSPSPRPSSDAHAEGRQLVGTNVGPQAVREGGPQRAARADGRRASRCDARRCSAGRCGTVQRRTSRF